MLHGTVRGHNLSLTKLGTAVIAYEDTEYSELVRNSCPS